MRRLGFTLALAAAALAAMAGAAAAASSLTIGLHDSRRVPVPGSIANVVVGDPNVADVVLTDAHSVILMGRGYGSTQLIITDHAGRTLLDSQVTVAAPDIGRVSVYRGGQNGATTSEYGCIGGRCYMVAQFGGPGSGVMVQPADTAGSNASGAPVGAGGIGATAPAAAVTPHP